MTPNNPLQKYFRQPKIFMSLPSKGVYYPEGALQGDHTNIPVFGMTGMDEIIMKTPDALFNGESTVKVIESCCPYIKNAWKMPSIDVDALLVGIRIATYGTEMDVMHTCPACKSQNDFTIDLSKILDHFSSLSFDGKIQIEDLNIVIRPLMYDEITKFNMENYKLQKMLMQLSRAETSGDDEETKKVEDDIYKRISEMQIDLFLTSIDNVQLPDGMVDNTQMIEEWLKNSDREFFSKIKQKLEANKSQWDIPTQPIKCENCGHESQAEITLDQANFFDRS
jgi:predicted Zn-ribbon and HTH transcriptional regulator